MTPRTRKARRIAAAPAALALLVLSTTPATADPSPAVPRASDMILPLAEVQAITKGPELAVDALVDRTSPWADHSQDGSMSAPCRHFANQDDEFGNTWTNFKSAGYSGESNIGIYQNIAVYPDAATASKTFTGLKTSAHQCRTHLPADHSVSAYTLTEQDPHTLLVQYPDSVNGPGSVTLTALRGQVIIAVGAAHYSTDPTIARTVLAHITHNIT